MKCAHPDCRKDAVQQWQRAGTAEESAAHVAGMAAMAQELADDLRLNRLAHLQQLKDGLTLVESLAATGALPQGDAQRMKENYGRSIAAAEHDIDGLPGPAEFSVGAVTVAVGACEEHQIDMDLAAQLHNPDCGCVTASPAT